MLYGQVSDTTFPVGRVSFAVGDEPLIGITGVPEGDGYEGLVGPPGPFGMVKFTDSGGKTELAAVGRLDEGPGKPALLPPSNVAVMFGTDAPLDAGKPVPMIEPPVTEGPTGRVRDRLRKPVLPPKNGPVVFTEDGGIRLDAGKPVLAIEIGVTVGTNGGVVEVKPAGTLEDGPGKPALLPPSNVAVLLGGPALGTGKPELESGIGVTVSTAGWESELDPAGRLDDGPGKPVLLPPSNVTVLFGSPPLVAGKPELGSGVCVTVGETVTVTVA